MIFGEETAIFVEDGQFGEGDAERVLDEARVLDLHKLDDVGDADRLDMATNAVLDEQTATDVETDDEELRSGQQIV